MSEIKNVVQIKRGPGQPADGVLFSYELGFDTSEGYLYIGNEAEQAVAQKIKAGYADAAGKLSTARTIQVDLASSSAIEFDGSKNIIAGVTGVLPVEYGGIGLSSVTSGSYLVGNDTSISLKTPAEVLADIGALGKYGNQQVENGGIYTIGEESFIGNVVTIDSAEHAAIIGFITDPDKGASFGYYKDYELKNILFLGDGYSYLNSQLFLEHPLAIECGGTGKNTHISNSILTGNGTQAINNITTENGAFYATSTNGVAKFGTLPIAQGGTGATTKEAALSNLGLTATAAELNYCDGVTSAIQTQLNGKVYVESKTAQIAGNETGTFTFSGNVKAVVVSAGYSTGHIMTGFWDLNTSGRTSMFYGYMQSTTLSTWETKVTISGKTVSVFRDGSVGLYFYVTAFCTP